MAKRPPKTSPQQANTYIQALEESRRRADMSREQISMRETLDRIEKVAKAIADQNKSGNTTASGAPGSQKSVEAIRKMLQGTLESMIPNTRAAYDQARIALKQTQDEIKHAKEITEKDRDFLRKFSEEVENEISKRSTAWTRGMSALQKSFKGLDSDLKSLVVGATTKSPILMIATKLLLRSKEERKDAEMDAYKASLDRKIEMARIRAQAEAEMNAWLASQQQAAHPSHPGGNAPAPSSGPAKAPRQPRQQKTAPQATAPPVAAPTPSQQATAPAPVDPSLVLLDDEETRNRDRARDFAIEQWLSKNPGKDLEDSPFARQDKVWSKPRQVGADGVQVTDEPVKESIDALTNVVAGQSEPIRESLHEDQETNELLHRVLTSGQKLAEDMEMRDEERARETRNPQAHSQAAVQQVISAASGNGGGGMMGGLLSALGLGGVVGTMGKLAGFVLGAMGGLGRGLMTAGRAILSIVSPAAKIAAAFGVGWAIGEGLEYLSKQFFGFSLKDAVADVIGKAVGSMVSSKEAGLRKPIDDANFARLRAAGYTGTLDEMTQQAGRANIARQQATAAAQQSTQSYATAQVAATQAPLQQTGFVSPYGQMVNADTTFGSNTPVPLASTVPMHASTPQVVAQGAMGNGAMKLASQWSMSPAGLAALKRREGFKSKPYKDGNSGRLAVGYGFQEWKGRRVEDWLAENPNFNVSRAEADAELIRRINEDYRHRVQKDIGNTPLTQSQFDALASIAFNAGHVPNNIERKIKNGEALTRSDFERTGTERVVKNGKFVGSRPNQHLMDRRVGEFEQFNTPATVATIAPRVAMTGQLSMASQNRSQSPVVISAPIVHAPQTTTAAASPAPVVMVMPSARNPEPSLNALTRLQTGN